MTKILPIDLSLVFFLVICVGAQTNSWHGVTPLLSSIEDVERHFGKPTKSDSRSARYKTDMGYVDIAYSSERCDQGWDVDRNTVLQISAYDIRGQTKEELGLVQGKQFLMTTDALNYISWIDPSNGLSYSFELAPHENGVTYILNGITYLPTREDNWLRCDGYPPYMPERYYFTMNTGGFLYPKTKVRDALRTHLAEIQSVVTESHQTYKSFKAYAVIYFDRLRPFKFYKQKFDQLVKETYGLLKISTSDFVFIEGGLRDRAEIEYYVLLRELPPPAPEPTLPSPEFMLKKKHGQQRHPISSSSR